MANGKVGRNTKRQTDLQSLIVKQMTKKDEIFRQRQNRLREISRVMEVLVPIVDDARTQTSATSIRDTDPYLFCSSILHIGWNFVMGTKLFPDAVDFKADITIDPLKAAGVEQRISEIDKFARRHGSYDQAVRDAHKDMVRGECWLWRYYEYNEDGTNKQLKWRHIPWASVRGKYGDEDQIIIENLSSQEYTKRYGKEMLNKVKRGGLINTDTTNFDYIDLNSVQQAQKERDYVQVCSYINEAEKIYAEIHGGEAFLYKLLEGEAYPFAESPLVRRMFYVPSSGYFGWGVLDMLLKLTGLDTTIANATANRAIIAADPLVTMATNNPKEAEKLWNKHKANRRMGSTKPFFIPDTTSGTKITPQNIDVGVNNGNMQIWSDFILDRATISAGFDIRSLTEYAPTAEQQRLRKQEQDKLNTSVLFRNAEVDRQFAKGDIELLKAENSTFHNIEVYLPQSAGDFPGKSLEELDELRNERGQLPAKKMTIAQALKEIKGVEMEITPRIDGVLDDQSYTELVTTREDIALLPEGTPAQRRAITAYFDRAHPNMGIRQEDLQIPAPEAAPAPVDAATTPLPPQ